MRILQIFGVLGIGGAETMVMNIYRTIDYDAFQFDFVVHGEEKGFFEQEIEKLGGRIYRCPKYSIKSVMKYRKWWVDFFMEHAEYRVLHSHIRSTASIYIPIAKKNGIKCIIHSHSTSNGRGVKALIKEILQYSLRYQADCFLACSQTAGEWLFGKRICSGERFFVFNNAIDSKSFVFNKDDRDDIRHEFDISVETFVLGFLARITEPKNPLFAIDVFAELHKIIPSSVILFVGDGELMDDVCQRVDKLKISNSVILTGARTDASRLLSAMDCYILPSIWEGFGVSLLEAQTSGLQCICSENIPPNAIVTDLVKIMPLSVGAETWAKKIASSNCFGSRCDMSERIIAAGFDVNNNVDKLCNIYKHLYGARS